MKEKKYTQLEIRFVVLITWFISFLIASLAVQVSGEVFILAPISLVGVVVLIIWTLLAN